jgi:hypothetical protein
MCCCDLLNQRAGRGLCQVELHIQMARDEAHHVHRLDEIWNVRFLDVEVVLEPRGETDRVAVAQFVGNAQFENLRRARGWRWPAKRRARMLLAASP